MSNIEKRIKNELAEVPWTRFFDLASGGGDKEDFELIYIQAPRDEAQLIFYNRFGHNPERVSCTCCGPDYSFRELEPGEEPTEDMETGWISQRDRALVIPAHMIEPHEREGTIPPSGYVWID